MKEIGKILLPHGEEKKIFSFVPETPPENQIIFPDKKSLSIDWRRNFDYLTEVRKLYEQAEVVQEEATVNPALDFPHLPALVWFPSDMHIGNILTDHQLLKKHIDLVIDTPNCYGITVGDDVDNGVFNGLSFEQGMPPWMQGFTVKDLAEELGGRNARKKELILARVTGNHDGWTFDKTGQNWEQIWYGETNAPVFPGMGLLHLKVGKENYNLGLAHLYWGRSRLNPTNVCKRLLEYEYPEADVVVVGHDHISEVLKFQRGGKERVALRTGTYKTKDYYARKHGMALRGQSGGACILFYPEEHKMLPFDKLEDGTKYLKTLIELFDN